jgi:hypothetical protein
MTSNYVIKFTSIRQRGLLEFYDEASDMIMKRCELARIIAHNQKEDTDVKDEAKHVISFKLDFDFTTILLFLNIVSYSVKCIPRDDYSKSDLVKIMCYMGFDRDMCDYIRESCENYDRVYIPVGHLWEQYYEDQSIYTHPHYCEDRCANINHDFKSFDDFLETTQCVCKLGVCDCIGKACMWIWHPKYDVFMVWGPYPRVNGTNSITIKVSKSDEEVIRKYIVVNNMVY